MKQQQKGGGIGCLCGSRVNTPPALGQQLSINGRASSQERMLGHTSDVWPPLTAQKPQRGALTLFLLTSQRCGVIANRPFAFLRSVRYRALAALEELDRHQLFT